MPLSNAEARQVGALAELAYLHELGAADQLASFWSDLGTWATKEGESIADSEAKKLLGLNQPPAAQLPKLPPKPASDTILGLPSVVVYAGGAVLVAVLAMRLLGGRRQNPGRRRRRRRR